MDTFINEFYDDPHNLSSDEYNKTKNILDKYKRARVEDKYILLVADKEITIKLFILYLYFYDYEINKDKKHKHHIGLDMEFNARQIALMQLNFGTYLWIIDPRQYNKDKIKIINEIIFLNKRAYKLLHGADALDIPYIYTELLENDRDKIIQFTKKYIDTRFLCEYVRHGEGIEGKCSIYDALLFFNTIDSNKYKELNEISDTTGPSQDVMWNIKKMSSYHIKYAYYDTLYLINFIKDIYKRISEKTPQYVRTYYYIMEVIRFVMLERKEVTHILNITKAIVNPINNYLVKLETNKTLITIYNEVIENFIIRDGDETVYLNFIESINYVKGIFSTLLKSITYYVISKKYKIYKNKNELMTDSIDIEVIYKELDNIGFYKITKLLKLFEEELYKIKYFVDI
jgi:hypothetical protein